MNYKRPNSLPATRSALLAAALLALTALPPAFGQEGKNARTWAFTHPEDSFSAKAVLDLRHLNEKEAGESGFLKLTPDGNAFALGNGKPIRLWAVGSDVYRVARASRWPGTPASWRKSASTWCASTRS